MFRKTGFWLELVVQCHQDAYIWGKEACFEDGGGKQRKEK